MTDMRRTLLWVVFSMSLFLIYDSWNKFNGHPSFFDPRPARVAAGPSPAPTANGVTAAGGLPSAGTAPSNGASAPVVAEQTTITTDLVRATLSGEGGTLTRLELLHYPDQVLKEWYEPLLAIFGSSKAAAAPAKDVV